MNMGNLEVLPSALLSGISARVFNVIGDGK